ncbi:MAG: hypothetical protein DMG35_01610 [Acidobacteria bacterium]|nr:MAG: hypothetical protein DMG35_01610 [Acidobacteriota bacterium]
MTRLPRVAGKEIVRALQKAGFFVDRTRGSHVFLKHPDGRARPLRRNHQGRAYCALSSATQNCPLRLLSTCSDRIAHVCQFPERFFASPSFRPSSTGGRQWAVRQFETSAACIIACDRLGPPAIRLLIHF